MSRWIELTTAQDGKVLFQVEAIAKITSLEHKCGTVIYRITPPACDVVEESYETVKARLRGLELEPLLTPCEVDDIFDWCEGKAERLAKQGELPCVKLPDDVIRFLKSDIQKVIEDGISLPVTRVERVSSQA